MIERFFNQIGQLIGQEISNNVKKGEEYGVRAARDSLSATRAIGRAIYGEKALRLSATTNTWELYPVRPGIRDVLIRGFIY